MVIGTELCTTCGNDYETLTIQRQLTVGRYMVRDNSRKVRSVLAFKQSTHGTVHSCNSSELRAPSCRSSAFASYLNTCKFHETSVSWEEQPATNAALRWIVHSGAAVVYRLEDKPRMSRQCVRSRAKRLDQTKDRRDLRSFPTSTKNGITMQDMSSTLSWLSKEEDRPPPTTFEP